MNYSPAIGDLLVRQKALGVFDHVGVLVGPNTVLQNTPDRGEHLATLQDFAAGEPIKVLPTGAHPAHVMARARQVLANAKAYNPFSRNCEHTVSEVVRGFAKSPQAIAYITLAVIILLLVVFWPRR
jgi:hypothetical protein